MCGDGPCPKLHVQGTAQVHDSSSVPDADHFGAGGVCGVCAMAGRTAVQVAQARAAFIAAFRKQIIQIGYRIYSIRAAPPVLCTPP